MVVKCYQLHIISFSYKLTDRVILLMVLGISHPNLNDLLRDKMTAHFSSIYRKHDSHSFIQNRSAGEGSNAPPSH